MISSLVLLAIFIFIPMAVVFMLVIASGVLPALGKILPPPLTILEILLLHFSLSLVYIANYPAVRAISPSLEIMLYVWSSPRKKMTQTEIAKKFTETTLVKARVDDLFVYRLLVVKDGRLALTWFGRAIVFLFLRYREMLGLPAGGG